MRKNWWEELTYDQLYRYMVKKKMVSSQIINKIKEDYNDIGKGAFISDITEPIRPSVRIADIPNCCGICEHYGHLDSFSHHECELYPDWPKKRAFFNVCVNFVVSDDAIKRYTTILV